MPIPDRLPTMTDALQTVCLGVEVASILDVGVLHGTPPLIEVFPDLPHYLFEPIREHHDGIKQCYAELTFELHQVALSDTDGFAWQLALCSDGSGNITHSQISNKRQTKEAHPGSIDSRLIRKARLDSL